MAFRLECTLPNRKYFSSKIVINLTVCGLFVLYFKFNEQIVINMDYLLPNLYAVLCVERGRKYIQIKCVDTNK